MTGKKASQFWLFVILLIGWENVSRARTDMETLVAEKQPHIQKQIKKIYEIYLKPARGEFTDNCAAFEEIQTLNQMSEDKGEIVKQLAIFAATTESEEDLHWMVAGGILERLRLPASIPIRVLAPYLDAENEKLRGFAHGWFHHHDSYDRIHGQPPLGSVNYHDYMQYVGNRLSRDEEIPARFIEYIYDRHPGKALLVFAYATRRAVAAGQLLILGKAYEARRQGRVLQQNEISQLREEQQQQEIRQQQAKEEQREIALAEHIVSAAIWLKENEFAERFQAALPEANAELAKLATHEEWWARLYVAHIMRQHPELRQDHIVRQLSEDSNPLVSKAAQPTSK